MTLQARPLLCTALLMLALARPAPSQQLLTNGNFETGTFSGWTLADQLNPADMQNQDHFYLSAPGTTTPAVDGITFTTAPNPAGGKFYAISTGDFPGAHALLQNFTVPQNAAKVTLSFQMFVNDQSGFGPVLDPTGLDYTTGGTFNDNQHARVDILTTSAGDLSTAPADIVENLYLGVDNPGGNLPNPYLNYTFNLTAFLTPGQSYRLRFAEVDNLSALNVGVDNVSLTASETAVPEPGLGALALLVGMGGLYARCRAGLRRREYRGPLSSR